MTQLLWFLYDDSVHAGDVLLSLACDNHNNIVSRSGDNYLTINYEKLAPLFVESIKDLKKELNELKLEIAELRNNK